MGIIDDYYGGYENLAMFTDMETGEVDFESAYNFTNFGEGFRFPNVDSDEFEDEEEKAEFYALMGEMGSILWGEGGPGGRARAGRGSRRGGRGRGRGQPVPGWRETGQYTLNGQQLFAGACSSCGQQCTVPFRPVQGRSAPCCRSCHSSGNGSGSGNGRHQNGAAAAAAARQPGSAQAASTANA